MYIRSLITVLPYLAVIAVAGIVGFSITRLDTAADEHQVGFTLGGTLIAAVAIVIVRAFSGHSARPFPAIPERKFLGVKIGLVGFCIALVGWLVAVFANHAAGFVLAVVGIIVGFVGMAIHFVRMFSPNE
jgi:hypothetical protein